MHKGVGKAGSHGDMDMEITFHSGLEGLGSRLLAKKKEEASRKGETVSVAMQIDTGMCYLV